MRRFLFDSPYRFFFKIKNRKMNMKTPDSVVVIFKQTTTRHTALFSTCQNQTCVFFVQQCIPKFGQSFCIETSLRPPIPSRGLTFDNSLLEDIFFIIF